MKKRTERGRCKSEAAERSAKELAPGRPTFAQRGGRKGAGLGERRAERATPPDN